MATKLTSKIPAIRAGLDKAAGAGIKQAAEYVNDLAAQLAPKDTGRLSQSGTVTAVNTTTYRVTYGTGLPDARARYQEYGTVKMAAQPYLTPAAQNIDVALEVQKTIAAYLKRFG